MKNLHESDIIERGRIAANGPDAGKWLLICEMWNDSYDWDYDSRDLMRVLLGGEP